MLGMDRDQLNEVISAFEKDISLVIVFRALLKKRGGSTIEIAREANIHPEKALEKLKRLEELGLAKSLSHDPYLVTDEPDEDIDKFLPPFMRKDPRFYISAGAYASRDELIKT